MLWFMVGFFLIWTGIQGRPGSLAAALVVPDALVEFKQMSTKRQLEIADIDKQIAEVQLRKAGLLGTSTPEEALLKEQKELEANKQIIKAEEQKETVYDKAEQLARKNALKVKVTGGQINKWLANIPTPGTYWTPLIILLSLFLVLFGINGHSRLGWFGLVLTGNAGLPTSVEITRNNSNTSSDGSVGTTQLVTPIPQTPTPIITPTPIPNFPIIGNGNNGNPIALSTNSSFLNFVKSSGSE